MAMNNLFSRDDLVVVADLAGQQFGQFGGNRDAGEIDGRRVQHTAHANRHVLIAHIGLLENELQQAHAALFLLLEQFCHLIWRQQTVFHQNVRNAFTE
jgi:hypothetical protein